MFNTQILKNLLEVSLDLHQKLEVLASQQLAKKVLEGDLL